MVCLTMKQGRQTIFHKSSLASIFSCYKLIGSVDLSLAAENQLRLDKGDQH